jgi:outer membrane protein OmpA-like peptidoglycan-associated protein
MVGVGLAAGLAGCARQPNAVLEQARASYQAAAGDPEVTRNAPVPLHEAQQALANADEAWQEGERRETEHLAYVAQRRVEIARAIADRRRAEQQVEDLHARRPEVLLGARTAEAERARASLAALSAQLQNVRTRETDDGVVFTMSDVLFEFDRADLKPGARQDLDRIAGFLRDNPNRQVLIEGHTDARGTEQYNADLSQRRAEAVRSHLASQGVEADQITARGYGEAYPVASNQTDAGRQENRRVDIVVLHEGMDERAARYRRR